MFLASPIGALWRVNRPASRYIVGLILLLAGLLAPAPAFAQTGSISDL